MLYYIILYYIILYYIILYYIILYYIILYYIILYYIILYYVMLCYVMLCYVMLCYVISYYIVLYYIMLCYIILYYIILYCYCSIPSQPSSRLYLNFCIIIALASNKVVLHPCCAIVACSFSTQSFVECSFLSSTSFLSKRLSINPSDMYRCSTHPLADLYLNLASFYLWTFFSHIPGEPEKSSHF